MIKKVFILTQFGSPHEWTEEYLKNVAKLGKYGWYWKIFTSNKYENVPDNVEIVPMTTDEFNDLVEKKLQVRPNMYMTEKNVPSVHVTDFYVFSGLIFEDYIKDFDFWGITNIDVVYGRLDKWVTDEMLEKSDMFSDELQTVNGVFCLFRNTPEINNLCTRIPSWRAKLGQEPCKKCTIGEGNHTLFGTDEYDMTEVMKTADVRCAYPEYYPMHSHDRLEQHVPDVKLKIMPDESLWELFRDTAAPNWIHARPFLAREIPYFHFIRTKKWPECLLDNKI